MSFKCCGWGKEDTKKGHREIHGSLSFELMEAVIVRPLPDSAF